MAQENDPRSIVILNHHLVVWWTVELGEFNGNVACGKGEKTLGLLGKTQEEVVETATVATVSFSEEEHEKLRFRAWCRICGCLSRVVVNIGGMSLTSEQVVTKPQQEDTTLKSPCCRSNWTGRSSACHQHSCCSISSERKSESHRCEGLRQAEGVHWQGGRFSPVLKKTEAFFAGAIKESEIMLVWSAEHVTETTVEHVELELTPTTTNVERCVPNVEFVLQQMHAAVMALTIYKATALIAETI